MRIVASVSALFFLTACGAGNAPPVQRAGPVPIPQGMTALTGVLGQNAAGLTAQFGKPLLDISEGSARKLQFGGPICVLDAYLYPPKSGRGEPTVTFAETRQRDGSPIDQSSCAAALKAAQSRR